MTSMWIDSLKALKIGVTSDMKIENSCTILDLFFISHNILVFYNKLVCLCKYATDI